MYRLSRGPRMSAEALGMVIPQMAGCEAPGAECSTVRQGRRWLSLTNLGHPVEALVIDGRLVRVNFCSGADVRQGPHGSWWIHVPGGGS